MSSEASEEDAENPGVWMELRPTAAIAQIFTFVALAIYMYALVPQCMCLHFRPSFFRQLAYTLQMIRLFMLMSALLPCVLHSQVKFVFPNLSGGQFAAAVLLALLGNIIAASGVRRFFECNANTLYCLLKYLPFMGSRCSKTDPCCCGECPKSANSSACCFCSLGSCCSRARAASPCSSKAESCCAESNPSCSSSACGETSSKPSCSRRRPKSGCFDTDPPACSTVRPRCKRSKPRTRLTCQ